MRAGSHRPRCGGGRKLRDDDKAVIPGDMDIDGTCAAGWAEQGKAGQLALSGAPAPGSLGLVLRQSRLLVHHRVHLHLPQLIGLVCRTSRPRGGHG